MTGPKDRRAYDRCPICHEDEPHTGTCGSSDPRALCNRNEPAPNEQNKTDAAGYALGAVSDGGMDPRGQHLSAATAQVSQAAQGWKEAAIAWEVCASLHRQY